MILSIHWGGNWGYAVPPAHRWFAHAMLDRGGVDVIHGHSSHHPMSIEVHNGKLILYGCGDLINDYEGIGGYEDFRSELVLMYLVTIEPSTRTLIRLEMVPFEMKRFRLQRASGEDAEWLCDTLNRETPAPSTPLSLQPDQTIMLDWH